MAIKFFFFFSFFFFLETFRNSKEVKNKAHYDYVYCYNLYFFILSDIWSAVENYFQKILNPPWKNPLCPFYLHPLEIQKVQVHSFLPTLKMGGRILWRQSVAAYKYYICERNTFQENYIVFTVILFLWFDRFLLHRNFGNNCIDDHETKMYQINLSC